MANVEWLDLPDVTSALGADLLALSQSGVLSNITVGNLFASPTAIGSTTPAAGTFTTLIGTTIDGVIGSITPAAGDFTTLKTTSTLMVGSTSVAPDGKAHIYTASAGTVTAISGGEDLVVEGANDTGISILTPDANAGYLYFGVPTNNQFIRLRGYYNAGTSYFDVSNSGNLTIRALSQQVAVGNVTTDPDGTLHVQTASAGAVTANAAADDLVVENSTGTGLSLLGGDAYNSYLAFGSPSAAIGAELRWAYSSGAMIMGTRKAGATVTFKSGNQVQFADADANQNFSIGTAAIATTATDGFLYIPTCAGAPTGTPTSKTGLAPMVYDSTNNKFWMYDGGWIGVALA